MRAPGDACLQQVVPGGMEFYFINAMSIAIVCMKRGREGIGGTCPFDGLLAARETAGGFQLYMCPGCVFALERFHEDGIGGEEIVVEQRWWLVGDCMSSVWCARRCVLLIEGDHSGDPFWPRL